jgi:hypothetical protein
MGGKIVSKFELPLVAKELGILNSSGAWFHFVGENGSKVRGNYRWAKSSTTSGNYIEDNETVRAICFEKIARYYRKNYLTVDETYKYLGNKLGEEGVDERCFSGVEKSEEPEIENEVDLENLTASDILTIDIE